MQRLSSLEDSVRSTYRTPSLVPETAAERNSTSPNDTNNDRPVKRQRTTSSVDGQPITTPELDTTQQPANEARHLISKELSTNGLLSSHQRSVLETAISIVDHLSHAPVPAITDRSTFDKSMHNSTDISQGEIMHVILGSELSHAITEDDS